MIDDATTAAFVSAGAWVVVGVLTGFVMHRVPTARLRHDRLLTRPAHWESRGFYRDRLRIHRWKDRLPEAGAFFRGGFAKRRIADRSPEHLTRWAAETRRAEYTHWLVMFAAPFFALWNPWFLTIAMVVYAVAANAPCLMIQRYNRARVARIAGLVAARRTRPGPDEGRAPTAT